MSAYVRSKVPAKTWWALILAGLAISLATTSHVPVYIAGCMVGYGCARIHAGR